MFQTQINLAMLGSARDHYFLTHEAPTPQNGQTHSNDLSAICRRIA